MHELGMCASVLAAVERHAAGRPVARVGVRAGALLRVVPEAFAQSFALVAAGSIADGAVTEVTVIPMRCRCRDCGSDFETVDATPACSSCGSVRVERDGGDDLLLEFIEYREPAADPATAPPVSKGA